MLHDLNVFVNLDDKGIKGLSELITGQVKHDFDPEEKVISWCVQFPITGKNKEIIFFYVLAYSFARTTLHRKRIL